jgi:hypothetical protein
MWQAPNGAVAELLTAQLTDSGAGIDALGGAPKESRPLLAAPSEQSAAPTTAEKVCALAPEGCRWPYGDPRHSDFRFCGNPIAEGPYCKHHRAVAYLARPRPRTRASTSARSPFPPLNSRAALLPA